MAEGGKEDDKDNPFSFKNFVSLKDKKKDDNLDHGGDDVLDIFDTTENPPPRKREKSRQVLVVEDDAKDKLNKKGKKENPFSFKKFLSTSASSVKPTTSRKDTNSNTAGGCVLPNIASDLPDFVQDHFCDSLGAAAEKGLELPDFDLGHASSPNSERLNCDGKASGLTLSVAPSNTRDSSVESDPELEHDNQNEDLHVQSQNLPSAIQTLPDFLSDGALTSGQHAATADSLLGTRTQLHVNYSEKSTQLHTLQEENRELRRQLAEVRERHITDTDSVRDLQQQIVQLKKKELEETAAMESAIQQVEQNLRTTTKRAVQAETVVAKLKQEIKSLQAEIKSLHSENEILRSGDKGLAEIKERTNYVADQLSSATKTAEASLKQLLSGVDNLKLLSQVLTSVDKISEHMTNESQENHKTFDDP